jgi:hypothetical protein
MLIFVSETVVIIKFMKQFQSFRYYFAAFNVVTFDSEPNISKTCSHAIGKQFDFQAGSVMLVDSYCNGLCRHREPPPPPKAQH